MNRRVTRQWAWNFLSVLLLSSCGLFSSGDPQGHTPSPPPDRSMIVYELPQQGPAWVRTLEQLRAEGFNHLVLSRSDQWLALSGPEQASCVAEAAALGFRVSLMVLEDTRFLDPAYYGEALDLLRSVTEFNTAHPDTPLAGAVADVEPHSLFSGKTEDGKRALAAGFQDLFRELADRLNLKQSPPLAVFTGWWYGIKSEDGTYPGLDVSYLGSTVDRIIPMVYDGIGGDAQDILRRVGPDLEKAPLQIGVGVHEYKDKKSLQAVLNALDRELGSHRNYRGTMVFHQGLWSVLPAAGDTPQP